MLTFETFLANAGLDPAQLSEADLTALRKSYDELAALDPGEGEKSLLEKAGEALGALTKSPKMLADLLHHMQRNAEQDPGAGDGDDDDGGMEEGDGEGDGEEDPVDEEELAGTMREMGLTSGDEGDGEEEDDQKAVAGKIRKALLDELGATEILEADEVVGTLLKAHGAALEAHSSAILAAVDNRLARLEAMLQPLVTSMQKSLDAASAAPTPRGNLAARDRTFGNPSLNPTVPDEAEGPKVRGVIIGALSKGLLDEATAHAMTEAVGTPDWEETWGEQYKKLAAGK